MSASELIQTLATILAPIPEPQRSQMLAWAEDEMQTRPLVEMCTDRDGNTWRIGEKLPTNENLVAFAMLVDDVYPQPCVRVYSFATVTAEGAGEGVLFFKETIFDPKYCYGALSPDALYRDFAEFFEADETRPADRSNGVHVTHAAR